MARALRCFLSIAAAVTQDTAARSLALPVLARGLAAEQRKLWQPADVPASTSLSSSNSRATADAAVPEDEAGAAVLQDEHLHVPFCRQAAEATEAAVLATDDASGDTSEGKLDEDRTQLQAGVGSQRRTYMKCLGTTTATRACHFQNVYYDIDSERFIYYGPEGAEAEVFGQPVKAGDPWLRLVRGVNDWKRERKTQFFLGFRSGDPLPPADRVVTFQQPLHLRAPMHIRSFGHFIRDNVLPLIDLPMRFGRDPVDFDWVRWPSDMDRAYWDAETPVAEHYRGLHSGRPSVTWQEVLDQALQGQPSGVKFIRFSEIVAGQGPADLVSHSYVGSGIPEAKLAQWAHMCDPYPFTAMREVAYRNHGLQVASVPDLEPFVLFLDGKAREKRLMVNAEEIIPKLKQTFPGVRMEHVQISTYTLQEQLELMSRATVVISSIGSRSFRLMYLPNGATMILIGPPEYTFTLEADPDDPGSKPQRFTPKAPLFEIDACWGFIGYVNMLQYHVTSEAEVRRAKPWTEWKYAREADTVLDEQKLTALLRVALQRGDCNVPYAGTGALAAYAGASA